MSSQRYRNGFCILCNFLGIIKQLKAHVEGFVAEFLVASVVHAQAYFKFVVLWEPFEVVVFDSEDSIVNLIQNHQIVISIRKFKKGEVSSHASESPVEMEHFIDQWSGWEKLLFDVASGRNAHDLIDESFTEDRAAVKEVDNSVEARFIVVELSSGFHISANVITAVLLKSLES